MNSISFFTALLVTHIIADWLFQTNWESKNKDKKLLPLLVHSTVYSLSFIPAFYFYKVSFFWLILLFVTHAILDQRKVELWFLRLKGCRKEEMPEAKFVILLMGVDQAFHIIFLAIIALLN